MNLTIRTSGDGLRGTVGIIEGATGSGVVIPGGVIVWAGVANAGGGVAVKAPIGAGVTDACAAVAVEVTVWAGVANAGGGVAVKALIRAGVADACAGVAVEATVWDGVADGDHKWNFEARTMATMTAQIIAPKPANNFQSLHGGIVGGATNFRLWRVTLAPALSRSSSRIFRACSSVGASLQPGVSTITGVDYADVREDRAVFYATVSGSVLEINYQIKSSNRGEFTVPPIFAESMYERAIKGCGVGGKIIVTQ